MSAVPVPPLVEARDADGSSFWLDALGHAYRCDRSRAVELDGPPGDPVLPAGVVIRAVMLYACNREPFEWVADVWPGRDDRYTRERVARATAGGFWQFYASLDPDRTRTLVAAILARYGAEAGR
jgi:hypothetical protein